jgi:hypothetical protein
MDLLQILLPQPELPLGGGIWGEETGQGSSRQILLFSDSTPCLSRTPLGVVQLYFPFATT